MRKELWRRLRDDIANGGGSSTTIKTLTIMDQQNKKLLASGSRFGE
ncbi:uncharacterized protein G2W53_044298 [Senna tora]|uniref:Uncharacterized protein n=1 Tax=Senna tora TaxID=362788 RepID=A0A834SQB1_9FABA|nr:uncharacterized protein G2W53_044298 [Senna tora]